ncbi:UBP-type zinc finger domain-containing protein [Streptomyces atroolivaceus]|uniref:UBP-type zinc finger domain-containing protein n=1 Tax=Streptomyces atroolivaceus TaxID=66869 RepID=A0ABV9VJV6_STRAZ|nr:UBP-type zinc finger domain-containing protein [Streptomyces atroolivaceus]
MSTSNGINPDAPPSGAGCVECEATGSWWFHLRRCADCGHIGCCDDSVGRHATAHARTSGHSVIQSFEPGESWFWDYDTSTLYESGPKLAPPRSHPADQTVPGPSGQVPEDWADRLG